MKNKLLLFIIISITLLINSCQNTVKNPAGVKNPISNKIVEHPNKLKFPDIKVTIPKPERIELDNGIILYLLEDHELPLIKVIARFKIGSIYDPQDKLGLANITAHLMRSGGCKGFTAEDIDEKLEAIGGELTVDADYEEINFELFVLKEDLEIGLEIFSNILTNPSFNKEKLDFEKRHVAESFRRQNENSGSIAYRKLRKAVYKEHPYGNQVIGTPKTVESITIKDVQSYYNKYIKPNNVFIGFSGDFYLKEMVDKIGEIFSEWKREEMTLPELPKLELNYKKSVNIVNKELNQTSIIMGHIGVKRTTPEYFPLRVMNAILGGSSASRIYHTVRKEHGLTYSIWSYFIMPDNLGMFVVRTDTKNESVGQATELILAEINKMRNEPVTDAELRHTKESTLNSFVFRFTDSSKIVSMYIYIELLKLGDDYLETYCDDVMKVTKEDIQRVANKYLHPDNFIYMFVGNEKEIAEQVNELGPVNILPLD